MKKSVMTFCALAALAVPCAAVAEKGDIDEVERIPTPIAIDLASPVLALPPFDRDVWGIRLDLIYGRADSVYGLDLGVVNKAKADVYGIGLGLFNYVGKDMAGIQLGVIGNYVGSDCYGLQVGGLLNYNDKNESYGLQFSAVNYDFGFVGAQFGALINWNIGFTTGLQVSPVNVNRAEGSGGMIAVINYSCGSYEGAQIGAVNIVDGVGTGLQLGVFNAAEKFTGVQIGLVNLNVGSPLPMMVIANAAF